MIVLPKNGLILGRLPLFISSIDFNSFKWKKIEALQKYWTSVYGESYEMTVVFLSACLYVSPFASLEFSSVSAHQGFFAWW